MIKNNRRYFSELKTGYDERPRSFTWSKLYDETELELRVNLKQFFLFFF